MAKWRQRAVRTGGECGQTAHPAEADMINPSRLIQEVDLKTALLAALSLLGGLAPAAGAESAPAFLAATPATVAWGYYWSQAKPVLTLNSGDEARIQTLSTCGSNERLVHDGVAAGDIPSYNDAIYREVKDKWAGFGGGLKE